MGVDQQRPTVAVWRSRWLAPSETFVRDHVEGLTRWQALTLGLYHEESGLDVTPDLAPFARTATGRRLVGAASRLGYLGIYDTAVMRRRPALVHAHFGTGAVEVLPIARRHRLPLVVTFHGHDVNRAPREDPDGRYLRRLRQVFEYADVLLAVSKFIATRLVDLGAPPEKVRVHYLGVPVAEPLADPRSPRQGIVFVGRLTRQKGVDDLLEAYAQLPVDVRRRTPLRIAGAGPERDRLEDLAGGIPDGDVEFLGTVPSARVRELLAHAALFVAPSKEVPEGDAEAFGLALIEASLAGVPVLSYDFAGVPEAVVDGRTGLLAPEGDTVALSTHMQRLLQDPVLASTLGAQGQQRVVEDFDAATQTALLEDLYDEVAHDSRRAGRRRLHRTEPMPRA